MNRFFPHLGLTNHHVQPGIPKFHQTVVEKYISPPEHGIRSSNKFPMPEDGEVGQHNNLTNIAGPQESKREIFSVLGDDGMG